MKNFNKMVILGTGDRDERGDVCITDIAKQRIHRAIEEAAIRGFSLSSKEPFILITGGYSKQLFNTPPITSEAKRMADYALRTYGRDGLTAGAFLLEEESTNTEENIVNSLMAFPEFFQETIDGERRLGIVSEAAHVDKAVSYASKTLPCPPKRLEKISVRRPTSFVANLSVYSDTSEQLQLTGDE